MLKLLAWTGTLSAIAATLLAFTPVNDCGTVLQPDTTRSPNTCDLPLANQWDAVWCLGLTAVVLLTAWQVINRRRSRA